MGSYRRSTVDRRLICNYIYGVLSFILNRGLKMPCRDSRECYLEQKSAKDNQLCQAVLCGIFSGFSDINLVLKDLDFAEMGVTRQEILDWWEEHKEYDRQRRVGIKRKKERENLKKLALSKLSEEEKKALDLY